MTNHKSLRITWLLLSTSLGGCAVTLPNTKPLVDASLALEQASDTAIPLLGKSYQVMIESMDANACDQETLKQSSSQDEESQQKRRQEYKDQQKALLVELNARLIAIQAIGQYAAHLDKIVQSAKDENEKIKQVHAAFNNALNVAEQNAQLAGPYGPAVVGGAEVVKAFNNLVSTARQDINALQGLRSLREALQKAGNSIRKLSELINIDTKGAPLAVSSRINAFTTQYETCHRFDYSFYETLLVQRQWVLGSFASRHADLSTHEINQNLLVGGLFGGKNEEALINAIDLQISKEKPYYDALEVKKSSTVAQLGTIPQLLDKVQKTMKELADVHADLGQQIDAGGTVDFTKLTAYAEQLKAIADSISKLQSVNP